MSCNCNKLNTIVDVEAAPPDFDKNLKIIKEDTWRNLKQCKTCGQLWRVDIWDRLQTQFAVKLETDKNWVAIDTIELQKDFLLNSRGGTDPNKICIWASCNLPAVKNVVYCINHLYDTGARN